MADAVTTAVLAAGPRNASVLLTCISDGTGEAAVVKVDKSGLSNALGVEPSRLTILAVEWSMQGFTYLKLAFDHTADDTALVLGPGYGELCMRKVGGLKDPASAGGTGDLLLTSVGATAGDSYTVLLHLVIG